MPDLNQIKQGEQGARPTRAVRQGSVRQSCRAAPRAHQLSPTRAPALLLHREATALCRTHPAAVPRTDGEVRPYRRSRALPRDTARELKATAMKAVISALAGGAITPGDRRFAADVARRDRRCSR